MRGGKREGAGRPKKEISTARPQNQIRAYPEEWALIKRFAELVKSDRMKAENILNSLE